MTIEHVSGCRLGDIRAVERRKVRTKHLVHSPPLMTDLALEMISRADKPPVRELA